MAVSVRSSSKNDSNTGTAMSVAAPTGAAAGDLMIVLAQHNGNTTIVDNTTLDVSTTNLTQFNSDTDDTSYATASITPSADKLIIAIVTSSKGSAPDVPTLAGCNLTWVQIATNNYDSTGTQRTMTMFRALGSSPTSGAVTATFAGTQTACTIIIDEITNADTSGTNGSGAIVQSATNAEASMASATFTVTLAAFSNTNNATYGAFSNGDSTTPTAGTSFTGIGAAATTTPIIKSMSEFQAANDTTVTFEAAAGNTAGGIAIEIKAKTIFTEDINDWQPIPTAGSTLSVFSRVLQSGDPSTYNFTAGSSTRWACIAICIQATTPAYDVSPNTANGGTTDDATSGTQVIPSITTGVANTLHIVLCGWDTSATGTITEPSGYTLLQSANAGGQPLSAAYKAIAAAGATGTTTYVNTEFGARIGLSFSVKESAAGTSVKTKKGLAIASVKTVKGLAIASVKTFKGLA